MSDQQDNTMIERLRERMRTLELDAAMTRARYEECRDLLAQAEGRRRPRRVVEIAQRADAPDDVA